MGERSDDFQIKRGTKQGAILSPVLGNVFICPLIQALDRSGRGAELVGYHVPSVCYADDIMLVSTNSKGFGLPFPSMHIPL